ncbi:MAG: sulfite exporter TauE/SafE family protein [Akkermansiaceae bacterium]|nr:sulfite exporter TauE/SafE family protein [Akkermansiaceae bacterium]
MTADWGEFAIALAAAVCIGVSKAGFSGISMLSVMLFAGIYGARASTGIVLPMLIAADIIVYPAFRRHGSWRPVWPLLAPMTLGLAAGWWLLGKIDDTLARPVIGGVILCMVGLETARRLCPRVFERLTRSPWFGGGAGVAGGFATMMANAAGPVIQLFLMSRRFPKMEMVGIAARLFLVVNLLKVPLSAGLSLITPASLVENAKLMPAVIAGILGGKALLHRVPQRAFDWLVVLMAAIAGARLCWWG